MLFLFVKAYLYLLLFDLYLIRGDFAALCGRVHQLSVRARTEPHESVERICHAVDLASIGYWKQVLCLQRSAATASLLRKHGTAAELVIGARQKPFKAHAWVEVAGCVVNDKHYVHEIYGELTRC